MIASAKSKNQPDNTTIFDLRLYVVDQSPRSLLAYANLKTVCDARLSGRYRIEVVDIHAHPDVARIEGIVAVPTVVRRRPKPVRTAIGDLSDVAHVLAWLGLAQQN
jgi:circadian clock protein KaiB